MAKKKRSDYIQVLPGILLVLVLIGIVFSSNAASTRLTETQAMTYLDQSSHRAAEEMEKNFARQSENILTMAHMTAHIMDYERIDTAKLIHLTEKSAFDGIEYIHPTGSCYGMNENSWSVADKAYFQDAAEQHAGYAYDDASERGEGSCVVFYAPILSDNGVFYGILVGYLREETLGKMLDISFWGHSIRQCLCTPEGKIIASNVQEKTSDACTGEECKYFAVLPKEKDGTSQYEINGKHQLIAASRVADGRFTLVSTFPPEVFSELVAPVMRKMHIAVAAVAVSITAYGVYSFFGNKKKRAHLENENEAVKKQLKGAEVLANRDELTGLYNRRGVLEIVNSQALDQIQCALIILDIDTFKQVNDNFGHNAGDALLIRVAQLLKETFREEDILTRLGGDEFMVIMPNMKPGYADVVKRKISSLNEKLQNPSDGTPAGTVSAGAAFSRNGERDELFARADKALYKVKQQGKCGCCIYEEEFED